MSDFKSRPLNKIALFDVDGTLSLARQHATPEMLQLLQDLRKKMAVGFVGGSNLVKIQEQLEVPGHPFINDYDFAFAENGLTAFRLGVPLPSASFINHVGEEEYKKMVKYILHYLADLELPIKRGTFIEFRNGMINVSPIGRNASIQERIDFEQYDKQHQIRSKFISLLEKEFNHLGLTFAIGGQISFDVFPHGWDKTYALNHVEKEGFDEIHFFGDKTYKGGNDYEIFEDKRVVGHTVTSPDDTMAQVKALFF